MKRSFELLDGKSAKFWEIELDGKSHTVRYGKLGHPWGQLISLDHAGKHEERDALLTSPSSAASSCASPTPATTICAR